MEKNQGISVMELVIYIGLLAFFSVAVVNMVLAVQNAFSKTRVERDVHAQGASAIERMVREIRLAESVDAITSVMNVNPGVLVLDTVVSPSDPTLITRKFFVQNDTLMLQEGSAPALPLTSSFKIKNLVFRNAGTIQPSDRYYYVRGAYSGCSDSNNGLTPTTAFCTISKAATLATAGSAVVVGAAVYKETVTLVNSGTASSPIFYLADVGGSYTGDAGEVVVAGKTYGFQFTSIGSTIGIDYTTIEGFKIVGSTSGIWAAQGSDYDVIRNNIITGNTDGIVFTPTWGNGSFAHSAGWLIEDNDIYGNTDDGITFAGSEYTDAIVQNNKIYNNARGITASDGGNGGFEPANNVTIRHNQIYSNTGHGIQGHVWFDGMFFNNYIYGNGGYGMYFPYRSNSSAQIITMRSNTVRANTGNGLSFGQKDRSGLNSASVFENNIITSNSGNGFYTGISGCSVFRNNDVWRNNKNYAGNCSDQTGSNSNLSQDPLYVGSSPDVHLQAVVTGHPADSPAIDTGYQSAIVAGLDSRGTRTDNIPDSGTVDMGYHYGLSGTGVQLFFAGNPASKAIRIELTIEGGMGRLWSLENLYGSAVLRRAYQ